MLDASLISLNIRFALWRRSVSRRMWTTTLADILQWDEARAEDLLAGRITDLNDEELRLLAEFGELSEGEMTSQNLVEMSTIDIFHANLAFLIDLIPHGEKKHFAGKLGVDATTISRWKNGSQHPTKKNVLAIVRHFNFPRGTDLNAEPLFLAPGPVGSVEIREWLHHRIDLIDGTTLQNLLPALKRLFKGAGNPKV